jgi:hypothetical protein
MYRVFMCAALAGVLAVPAKAQSLREQVVGAWELVSCRPAFPWCAGSNGTAIYEANGRYAVTIAARGRSKVTLRAGREGTSAEDYKAIATGFFANFGTWSMNGATITHHVDGALFPNIEGTDFGIGTISISGDLLTYTDTDRSVVYVWRRIK